MRSDVFVKPILVVPAIPKDGGIKFIMPKFEFFLGEDVSERVWNILELCNGVNTIDAIVERIGNKEDSFVTGLLNDLNSLGIVMDSRKYFMHFHSISSNPAAYQSDITGDEILEHANSLRSSVKVGQVFKFHRNISSSIFKLQELRKSCRNFSKNKLSIDELGGILDIGYSYARHAVPSAGGLYPMKLFAVVLEDQKDFPAGYYEYDNEKNCLVLFNNLPDEQRILYSLNETEMPFGAQVVLVIAADSNRQTYKYSNRGYRFMAIEAGEIAQNISLAAVEVGLATCELGGFLDEVIQKELQIESCLSFLVIAVGKASSSAEQKSLWQIADEFEKSYIIDSGHVQSVWSADNSLIDDYDKSYAQFLAMSKNNQIASGVSTCLADAKLKAIAEAYERQCSSNVRWDIIAKAADLSKWLDPRVACPLTDDQYCKLNHLQKFTENLEIEWVEGINFDSEPIYVPIDLVFYPIENISRKLVVDTCSSGFAAYTDRDEAIKRGMMELIERDSLMRSWYETSSPTRLNETILPVHLKKRVSFWKDNNREVIFLDLSQNGVIVVEVIIKSVDYPCFVSGAASSIDDFSSTAVKAFYEAESRLISCLNNNDDRKIIPNEVVGVLDHELLYSQSDEYHKDIEFLWSGEVTNMVPIANASIKDLLIKFKAVIIDIASDEMLFVVKILSPELIPIDFGFGSSHYSHHSLCKPNVQREVPHYFA